MEPCCCDYNHSKSASAFLDVKCRVTRIERIILKNRTIESFFSEIHKTRHVFEENKWFVYRTNRFHSEK